MKVICHRQAYQYADVVARESRRTYTKLLPRRNVLELAYEPVALFLVVRCARVVREVVLELSLAVTRRKGTLAGETGGGEWKDERVELVDGGGHDTEVGGDGHLRELFAKEVSEGKKLAEAREATNRVELALQDLLHRSHTRVGNRDTQENNKMLDAGRKSRDRCFASLVGDLACELVESSPVGRKTISLCRKSRAKGRARTPTSNLPSVCTASAQGRKGTSGSGRG
jgi:hypothetical protein